MRKKREIVYIKTHDLNRANNCPECGAVHDAATGVNDNIQAPVAGSLGVCYDCACILRYDSAPGGGLMLRTVDGGEFFDLPLSIQKKLAFLSKEVKNLKNKKTDENQNPVE